MVIYKQRGANMITIAKVRTAIRIAAEAAQRYQPQDDLTEFQILYLNPITKAIRLATAAGLRCTWLQRRRLAAALRQLDAEVMRLIS